MNSQTNPVVRILMIILAAIFVAPVEGAKWLNRKVYEASGFTANTLSFILSLATSFEVAKWASSGYPWYTWLGLGLITFAVSVGYVFPIVYLLAIHPVYRMLKKAWTAYTHFAQNQASKIVNAIVNAFSDLPGSKTLWSKADALKSAWFVRFIDCIAYCTFIMLGLYTGHEVYNHLNMLSSGVAFVSHVAVTWGCVVLAILAGVAVTSILVEFMANAGYKFVTIILGMAAAWSICHFCGINPIANTLTAFVAFVLAIAYVYPLVVVAMGSGFWKRVYKKWEPIVNATYTDPYDTKTLPAGSKLFRMLVSLGLAFVAYGLVNHFAVLAVTTYFAASISGLAAILVYTLMAKWSLGNAGNSFLAIFSGLYLAAKAGLAYYALGLPFGVIGGFVSAILAAVATWFVAFPAAYMLFTTVIALPGLNTVAAFVVKAVVFVQNAAYTLVKKVYDQAERIYNYGYVKPNAFNSLATQIANIAIACGLGYLAFGVSANAVEALAMAFVTFALSYLLIGKIINRNSGINILGALTGLACVIALGKSVYPATGLAEAMSFSLVAGSLVYTLIFPAVFIAVRFVANPVLMPWLLNVLEGVYNFAWKHFGTVWNAFLVVYHMVAKVFDPIVKAVFNFLRQAWLALKSVWSSIFKH